MGPIGSPRTSTCPGKPQRTHFEIGLDKVVQFMGTVFYTGLHTPEIIIARQFYRTSLGTGSTGSSTAGWHVGCLRREPQKKAQEQYWVCSSEFCKGG